MAKKRRNRNRKDDSERAVSPQVDPQQRRIIQQIEASVTSGPLPPPEVLAQYSQVVQDGAERIMRMAEKQNDHRIKQEGTVIAEDIVRQRWGLGLGFVVAALGLAAASYISAFGNPIVGGVVAAFELSALAGVFVYGTRSRSAEREDRARLMTGRR